MNIPSAETASISGNDGLGDLAVLLVSLPQVVLIRFEHHVADEEPMTRLLSVGTGLLSCRKFVSDLWVMMTRPEVMSAGVLKY